MVNLLSVASHAICLSPGLGAKADTDNGGGGWGESKLIGV